MQHEDNETHSSALENWVIFTEAKLKPVQDLLEESMTLDIDFDEKIGDVEFLQDKFGASEFMALLPFFPGQGCSDRLD